MRDSHFKKSESCSFLWKKRITPSERAPFFAQDTTLIISETWKITQKNNVFRPKIWGGPNVTEMEHFGRPNGMEIPEQKSVKFLNPKIWEPKKILGLNFQHYEIPSTKIWEPKNFWAEISSTMKFQTQLLTFRKYFFLPNTFQNLDSLDTLHFYFDHVLVQDCAVVMAALRYM